MELIKPQPITIELDAAEKAAATTIAINTGQPVQVMQIDVERAEPEPEWELEL